MSVQATGTSKNLGHKSHSITKSTAPLWALMLATATVSQASAQEPSKPNALTMNVFSGLFESCIKKTLVPAFESSTGITLNLVTTQPPLAKLQAEGDSPEIDVFVAGQSDMKAAHDYGILSSIDAAALTNLPDIYKPLANIGVDGNDRYSVVFTYNPTGLVYNGDLWKAPPTSWFDLASEGTPGIVNVRMPDSQNTVAWLAIMAKAANGDWPTKLTDYDKTLELVRDKLKPKLGTVLPSSGAMQSSFVDDPRSSLTVGPQNVAIAMAKRYKLNIKWAAPKEGAYLITTEAGVTKTKNSYWAHKLIDAMLDEDFQKSFAECGYYSPVNSKTKVDASVETQVVQGEENVAKIMQLPWEKITPLAADLGQAFLASVEN
ncbi:ABC transporter substrate-binding protein [Rhizobium leguminosarum]|uniref:ABC transporter substrate-binding protein n=1 Tax=Rhizobium leguminosarum TaxID=384 RepID=UPI000FEC8BF2|nr:extracellular solute-binding protein [Rhizobium leguminosarum]RWX35232.1 extracellular solute-binding protein [Rhizobium leguminosarum]